MSATAEIDEFDVKEFGRRLHAVARWEGLSNNTLATQMDIHPESIRRHMAGETIPNVAQLDRYLRILSISSEALMDHRKPLVLPQKQGESPLLADLADVA
jgi:ribosome-binding protein aMBF1 (putative translation factor)